MPWRNTMGVFFADDDDNDDNDDDELGALSHWLAVVVSLDPVFRFMFLFLIQ
jgi:hypothetical protein